MSSKIRLYFSKEIQSDLISHLSDQQSHYLKDVMRLKPGDSLSIFNSDGEWHAIVENYEKGNAKIKILKKMRDKKNEKNIWLAFSPIKQNSLNFMIQKATELGVQKFVPVICERSSVKDINIERLKKIIIESSEQSNRIALPKIIKKEALKNFLNNFPKDGLIIFCDINYEEKNLKDIFSKKIVGPICILVGPEGDFSESERQFIIDLKQSCSLSLSSNILKTETAAVAAVTIVNFQLNST
tara:strand:- start:261 stop:983 length:723 start_codon:yes stop_codon:yes gene_type:complete